MAAQRLGCCQTPQAHVLLAEDNALNLIVNVCALERMGHKVTISGDGAAVVAAVGNHAVGHFDVVLMDLHMPEVDGLEATRRIRALPQGAGLPILAFTAAAMPEDREKCLAAGLDDHIAKPVEPEDPTATLRRALPRSGPIPGQVDAQPVATSGREASAGTQGLPDMPAFDTLMGSAVSLGAMRMAEASAELHAALRDSAETPETMQTLMEALRDSVADAQRAPAQRRH